MRTPAERLGAAAHISGMSRTRTPNQRTRQSGPQPRRTQGPGNGQFANRQFRDGELTPMSDRDWYTAQFADLDAFTIERGEVVDFDPSASPSQIGEYQSLVSNGYENRI
jgi:hypothetical protein